MKNQLDVVAVCRRYRKKGGNVFGRGLGISTHRFIIRACCGRSWEIKLQGPEVRLYKRQET